MKRLTYGQMPLVKTIELEDSELIWEISDLAGGFHVNCVDPLSAVTGSGFALSMETAKQKAFCELNERILYSQLLRREDLKAAWGFDFDRSGSGFAAGFSPEKTTFRSLCEGIERWALSQWIDGGYALSEIGAPEDSYLITHIQTIFDKVDCLTAEVPLLLNQKIMKIHVSVVLAWLGDGVFVGYGTKASQKESLEHASVESLRNWLIFKNQEKRRQFPFNRIEFFARHADVARNAISEKREVAWPVPTIRLFRTEKFGEIHLARSIFEGWTPWQHGPLERFLY